MQTIIDSSSSVSAKLSESEESIICKGILSDELLKAMYIPVDAEIEVEDVLETSGMGGIYPKGITIRKDCQSGTNS